VLENLRIRARQDTVHAPSVPERLSQGARPYVSTAHLSVAGRQSMGRSVCCGCSRAVRSSTVPRLARNCPFSPIYFIKRHNAELLACAMGVRPDRWVIARAESSVPFNAGTAGHQQTVGKSKGSFSDLSKRILTGCLLGAIGASVIVQGGLAYFLFMEFFVYHSSREYFSFVVSTSLKEGNAPPPKWSSYLLTLCCMALPLYSFVTGGKIAVALAISSFLMLSIFVTQTNAPRLATLSSAIFGLLYCGVSPSTRPYVASG
jgi:hypothetical protein